MNHRWVGLKLDKFKHVAITTRRHGIKFYDGISYFWLRSRSWEKKEWWNLADRWCFVVMPWHAVMHQNGLKHEPSSPSCASWGNIGLRQIQARFQHRGSGWCLKSSDLAAEIIFDFIYIWLYIIILCTYKIYVCICFMFVFGEGIRSTCLWNNCLLLQCADGCEISMPPWKH